MPYSCDEKKVKYKERQLTVARAFRANLSHSYKKIQLCMQEWLQELLEGTKSMYWRRLACLLAGFSKSQATDTQQLN